ncbi:hypothetical protein FRC12_015933 [Ceratobasidium sp. 428]|nr:hypothetical protein FRC12_015933 [Ceratobasidium sp. 428]
MIDSEHCIYDLHRDTILSVGAVTPSEEAMLDGLQHFGPSFDIRGIRHYVDVFGGLWFQVNLTGEWWRVALYAHFEDVMLARMEFLELQAILLSSVQASRSELYAYRLYH